MVLKTCRGVLTLSERIRMLTRHPDHPLISIFHRHQPPPLFGAFNPPLHHLWMYLKGVQLHSKWFRHDEADVVMISLEFPAVVKKLPRHPPPRDFPLLIVTLQGQLRLIVKRCRATSIINHQVRPRNPRRQPLLYAENRPP